MKPSSLIYVATPTNELAKKKFPRKASGDTLGCTERKISKNEADATTRIAST